jgi:hypothetical protein
MASFAWENNLSFGKNKRRSFMSLNPEVTQFLELLEHPLGQEIDALRRIILQADERLTETVKWNGPNYSIGADDRITIRIQPPKQIQLIFLRGAKVKPQSQERLLKDEASLLVWKGNDRAIACFTSLASINEVKHTLTKIVQAWLVATASPDIAD